MQLQPISTYANLCAYACPNRNTDIIANVLTDAPHRNCNSGTSSDANSLHAAIYISETHMMDEMAGWAWAGVTHPNYVNYTEVLLHTLDGGQTWTDVTPENTLDPNAEFPPNVNAAWFFLDAQTAWVAPGDERLMRTSDGGKTWIVTNKNLEAELVSPFHDYYYIRFLEYN